jgi:Na+-transporting NADH:ubiquinone oxidoreductase subunit A
MISITRGLDLPITGEPKQTIETGPTVTTVALVAGDYIGMKPTMIVKQGDSIRLGQILFEDKKNPGVRFTSPGCGKIAAINRGAKRALQSVIIELDGNEEETFQSYHDSDLTTLTREQVRENLLNSGLWTCLRTRPYGKLPHPDSTPHSLFVTAMDSNPLAANPELIIGENEPAFVYGLQVIRHLTDGKLFLCKAPGTTIAGTDLDFVTVEEFQGPHPAGLPGTHIHYLDPVSDKKTVWHLNYQDVIAIGKLFATGKLCVERVISLGGPSIKNPRLLRTRIGANCGDLTREELDGEKEDTRVLSGSVLSGRTAVMPVDFLGRFHLQVSALSEGRERVFLGWQRPGFDKFSVKRVFASALMGAGKKFRFSTSTEGSKRAMVPIGIYEKVLPMDIIPTFLLRALIVGDTEQAQALGCLELTEEDLALCTFVCPGKYEYGPLLRHNLLSIEKEG